LCQSNVASRPTWSIVKFSHKQGPPDAYSGGPLLCEESGRDRSLTNDSTGDAGALAGATRKVHSDAANSRAHPRRDGHDCRADQGRQRMSQTPPEPRVDAPPSASAQFGRAQRGLPPPPSPAPSACDPQGFSSPRPAHKTAWARCLLWRPSSGAPRSASRSMMATPSWNPSTAEAASTPAAGWRSHQRPGCLAG